MESKFFNWYTQSLGGTFGIISCICAYLNGYMFVYTNSASKILINFKTRTTMPRLLIIS